MPEQRRARRAGDIVRAAGRSTHRCALDVETMQRLQQTRGSERHQAGLMQGAAATARTWRTGEGLGGGDDTGTA